MQNNVSSNRLPYLSNLRSLLTIMVVLMHISITYGAAGSWYYNEPTNETVTIILLTIYNAVAQSFVLGMFFMTSGYLTPSSFERKGSTLYFKDRLLRLGVPFLIYFFIISPILVWTLYTVLLKQELAARYLFGSGPLWFVQTLLIFSVLYYLWRRFLGPQRERREFKTPAVKNIALYIIALSAANFIVRIWYPIGAAVSNLQFSFFPGYMALFIIGIIAFHNNWFKTFPYQIGLNMFKKAIIAIPVFPIVGIFGGALEDTTPFLGGFHWQSLFYSSWEAFVGTGMILGVLVLFRERVNFSNPLLQNLSDNAYTVYIIHAPVIIFYSLLLRPLTIHPLLKFVIVSVTGVILCFLISHYLIRRLPYAKAIL